LERIERAAVAEFIGTFALIFFGAGSVILFANGQVDLVGVALAHGLVMAIMVSQMGHLSGGVFNPAIQAALWATGKMPTTRSVVYVVAQFLGAVAAAYALKFLVPKETFDAGAGGTPALAAGLSAAKGVLFEAVGTFFLVWAVFATAVDDRGPFNKTAGLTIGLTITFGILAIGPWTGAALNLARWFGPALAAGDFTNWYIWVAGPLSGGIIAGVLYWYLFLKGKEPATP
jgi:MIP family channel proteins